MLYLTTSPISFAVTAQAKVLKKIADQGSCIIVDRAANYVNKTAAAIVDYINKIIFNSVII